MVLRDPPSPLACFEQRVILPEDGTLHYFTKEGCPSASQADATPGRRDHVPETRGRMWRIRACRTARVRPCTPLLAVQFL